MRIAVLGAGPVGTAMAALAARAGHEVRLWSPRGAGTRHLVAHAEMRGALLGRFPVRVCAGAARAAEDADCVLFCVPGHVLPGLLQRVVPALTGAPALLLCPPGALSALLARHLADTRGLRFPVGALPVPPVAARRDGAAVEVLALRERWWIAADPALAALAGAAFGLVPLPLPGLLCAALADPVARLGTARLLGTAGDPARLLAGLETEAAALAGRLGCRPPGLEETGARGLLAAAAPDAAETGAGLAFAAALGRAAGVTLPLTEAALRVLEAAHGAALGPHPVLAALPPEALGGALG